ncbi:hypothetical protein [Corynebacterium otitidis]|uniref:HTH cro/C1-type domain-containing protein n=1 Tax=Corynebacterium otitidis ATCC 51513 TaxID=883169 RepID=I7KJD6_9CORY|nr:hypothetical protein [Corynebacterium otitidis]EJZ82450.1 hypothetical protein HMPREF9719_00675 [Corynebacterium otitidis ATCC 51513]KKO84573.1 DNA-binding protein [Corynebacterium otitidis]CCI83555.1 hypothetical protein BN46_0823 [Corynebacterium otitidis ATCC 51513]
MLAIHARYRGTATRRAALVEESAKALSRMPGVGRFEELGVEDRRAPVESPEALCDVVMALIADGEWALGIGIAPGDADATGLATASLPERARAGHVGCQVSPAVDKSATKASNIAAAFALLSHVLNRRSPEGREATSLVRRGYTQTEAAEALGVSKQAVSQRLAAAGWRAEAAGWQLAVNLVTEAAA